MKKKIDKKTREQAALICAAVASTWPSDALTVAAESMGAGEKALELALDCSFGEEWYLYDDYRARWASAESALRTGWSPS